MRDVSRPKFPILQVFGSVAFIDDDVDFLDSASWQVKMLHVSFHSVRSTLEPVLDRCAQALDWERNCFLELARAQPDFVDRDPVVLGLQYLHDPRRLDVVGLLVADYAMPGEDGLQLCGRYALPGMQRMLLTGYASEKDAVQGFNSRLIEHYIPKHVPWADKPLEPVLQSQLAYSCVARSAPLEHCLSDDLKQALADPVVVSSLRSLLAQQEVVEYIFLGNPQGLLCATRHGSPLWIQVETHETLGDLAEILQGEPESWSDEVLARVKAGETLVNSEVARRLDLPAVELPAQVLRAAPLVVAAAFSLAALPESLHPVRLPRTARPNVE